MMPKPPIEFLVDSFEYKDYLGEGDWNKPVYTEPILIENCRIDKTPQYTATTSGKQLLFNAVIFCYPGLTSPIGPFKEQGLVIYDGQEHVITSAIPIKEAYSDDLYSYELEVV
ncbi:minor capsid protein [Carnobacterium maltaromaticum]|uniref:minor capsid protein n=1 Tax=Carnobacterium maltaromaticum TaxID=2751 RepID=UPI0039BE9D48